jgi:hypothetical protein
MCRIRLVFAILLGLCGVPGIAGADDAEAWAALRAGRHVALMRHPVPPAPAIRLAFASRTVPLSAISAPRDARTPQR